MLLFCFCIPRATQNAQQGRLDVIILHETRFLAIFIFNPCRFEYICKIYTRVSSMKNAMSPEDFIKRFTPQFLCRRMKKFRKEFRQIIIQFCRQRTEFSSKIWTYCQTVCTAIVNCFNTIAILDYCVINIAFN